MPGRWDGWQLKNNLRLAACCRAWLRGEKDGTVANGPIDAAHLAEAGHFPLPPRNVIDGDFGADGDTLPDFELTAAPWRLRDRDPSNPLVQAFELIITTVNVTAAYEFFYSSCSSSAADVKKPF